MQTARQIRYVPAQYERYYAELNLSFDAYLKRFSSKSRATLLRKVRKFADFCGGSVPWREYSTPEEMDEFIHLARQVSAKTYQERLLNAGLPDTKEMRSTVSRFGFAGYRSWLYSVHWNRTDCLLILPCKESSLIYEYLGFDPLYREHSPGIVLQYMVMERLLAGTRFLLFDFTEGKSRNKKLFSTNSTRCADVYYFRNTLSIFS